jgi:hypothetical protein
MYKPKVRVNVAEGAYVVILNWQAERPSVKGAEARYVSNNGREELQVSRFHAMRGIEARVKRRSFYIL